MRKWQLITAATVGIMASGYGFIQANAAIFSYQVDFLDKEVANFDDFTQVFNVDTYDLDAKITWNWFGTYYWDTPGKTMNVSWDLNYRINGTGFYTTLVSQELPDFLAVTDPTNYNSIITTEIPEEIVQAIMNDDTNFVEFQAVVRYRRNSSNWGSNLIFENSTRFFNLYYDFNTTYLFNYFLSDQQFVSQFYSPQMTVGIPLAHFLEYVYTTAGNDTYLIENSLQTSIGTTRKKYAIDVEGVWFRGESVGAQFRSTWDGTGTGVNILDLTTTTNANLFENQVYRYYFLNSANVEQEIMDVPQFDFEEEDCGSFLALNVGCFVNNALAYITNDAPIISDAITLLNAGMQMAGQAFGVIGSFTQDNVFGVLVLGGLGITAVRWFLKND